MEQTTLDRRYPLLMTGLFLLYGLIFGIGVNLFYYPLLNSSDEVLFWSTIFTVFFVFVFSGAIYYSMSKLQDLARTSREQLETQTQRLEHLVSNMPGLVFRCRPDQHWTMLFLSDGVEELTGYTPGELLHNRDQSYGDLVLPEDYPDLRDVVDRHLEEDTSYTSEYRIRSRDDEVKWVWEQGRPVRDERSDDVLLEGFILDITERKRAEQRAKTARKEALYEARHDSLTGLYDREWFLEQAEEQLNERNGSTLAFCILDVDNFIQINDFYGHWVGNSFLRQVGNWLSESVHEDDLLGRLGADEFAFTFPCLPDQDPAELLRERLGELSRRFHVQGIELHRSVTVGIGLYPEHGDNLVELMAAANRALNRGKETMSERITVFREEDRQHLEARVSTAERLMRALGEDRLQVVYQPIVNTQTGETTFQEALLRIHDEEGNELTMGEFREIVHDGQVTGRLDRWVVEQVLRQIRPHVGDPPFRRVAINLFPPTVVDRGFYSDLEDMLEEFDFPTDRLLIEISEKLLQDDRRQAGRMIREMSRDKPFHFVLDDFGVGHGSFQTLKTLPMNYLKIDGSFITGLTESELDRNFVRTIASLCRDLDITAVGEWIEDKETANLLQDLGVPNQQGFHHARPSPLEECLTATPG